MKSSSGIPPQRPPSFKCLFPHIKVIYLWSETSPYKPVFLNPENGTTKHSVYLKIQYRLSNVGRWREQTMWPKLDDNSKQLLQ